MSVEQNKEIVSRLYKEVFQEWDTSLLNKTVTDDFQDHLMNGPEGDGSRGPAVLHQLYAFLRGAFPDLRFETHDIIAEHDKVMVRWSFAGTHKGEFRGVSATGVSINVDGIAIYRMQDEKIAERWVSTNLDQLIQKLSQTE